MRTLTINIVLLILNGYLFGSEDRPNPLNQAKKMKEEFSRLLEEHLQNHKQLMSIKKEIESKLAKPEGLSKSELQELSSNYQECNIKLYSCLYDANVLRDKIKLETRHIQSLENPSNEHPERPSRAQAPPRWQTSFQRLRSEQPEDDGKNALHLAVWRDNEEEVKRLLDTKQIGVNWKDKEGWTPLHMAAYKGNKKLISLLIEHGAQDVRSKDGTSCVAMAQDDATQEAMFFAWRKRHAQAMLALHPTLQAMRQLNLDDEEEDTEQLARTLALSQQEAEDRKLDGDIDQVDKPQNQKEGSDADEQQLGDGKLEADIELDPFEKALWDGNLEEVRQLIRSGIDPSQKQFGAIPIIWLAVQRYIDRRGQANEREIIIELINAGADLNVRLSSLFKKKPIFIQGIRTWHINELEQFINDFSEYLPASLLQEAIEEAKKLRERYRNHPESDFSKKISLLEQKYADRLASCEE